MQKVREKHFEAVRKVRDKIKDELLKDSPSRKTLYGYAGELGELHKQITKERSNHLLKVKKILNPEQFKKLIEHENRMGKGKFGNRGHRKGRRGGKGNGRPRDGSGPGCRENK
jgi:Spy/CpxP family protein refolding chaperone